MLGLKVLVTGASGFLGSHLCPKLADGGHEVVAISSRQCDLRVQGGLESFLEGHDGQFDRIFHLAAWTQAGDFALRHQGEQWIINQRINTNVLGYWREKQPQAKMVSMGTSCSYDPALPLSEENYMTGLPIESLFTYAMTKRMLYAGMLALKEQYGMKFMCFVPSTLYGPGYHPQGKQMHFIFDLIRKIVRAKKTGEQVKLWGDGHQRRELVFVDDFVRIMLELTEKYDNELVNIGAGEEFAIRHFASLICRKVGYSADQIAYDQSRYVGAKSKCLLVGKLKKLLPDYSLLPLEEGLSMTIEWFEKNGETA